MVKDFIFELGCEELPSGAVWTLANEFVNQLLVGIDKAQLSYGTVKRFATPRRLAVIIHDLQTEQAPQHVIRRGPAFIAAYDSEGNPTPALLGFARSCGVPSEQLKKTPTDKGDWMVYETEMPGKTAPELLPILISQSLAALPIPKPMRWGNKDVEFARPVHWAVMLYGDNVMEYDILGIKSGRFSRGHRFHCPQSIEIQSASSYEDQMKEAFVLADFSARRQLIQDQVNTLASNHQATAVMPDDLLDEVTSIVEWPQALLARFEQEFLEVPAEALIASMQSHQKCFALKDQYHKLLPFFITVANIQSTNPQQVVSGNEKVMRARLSDAAFFFRQDKKLPLIHYIAGTQQVVFQTKLGSLYDKAERIKHLMNYLSKVLSCDMQQAERAAILSKCDLLTGMVGEFPELQGLMGYYYALNDNETPAVAKALDEQYMPRFAADRLPESLIGTALSLADRMDTLVGIFAIGQKPSGVKDPFKLRRHALAIVRLLLATPITVNLSELIHESMQQLAAVVNEPVALKNEIKAFILERLNSYYQGQGISADLVLAVRAKQDESLYDLDKRLQALIVFVTLPEATSLSAACKRVNNLLGQTKHDYIQVIDSSLFTEAAEKNLYQNLQQLSALVEPLYKAEDYSSLLKHLAAIREPVDSFFDQVMVMVDDHAIKNNRLALLAQLQALLRGVADISML